jgi:SAM-dependent methyltransferase
MTGGWMLSVPSLVLAYSKPVRDPFGLNERLFALWYPPLCEIAERAGQRETRHELISQAAGRTLEIGAGSGLNLCHYTAKVSELIVTEPSPHMRKRLRTLLSSSPPPVGSCQLVESKGEELPFEDGSFDTITGTYILCTIADPGRALVEFARVLKPGGQYLFFEHVHAGDDTLLGKFQDQIAGLQRYVAAGCHPNRRTEALLAASPLQVERIDRRNQPRAFPSVRPVIVGSARRRDNVGNATGS